MNKFLIGLILIFNFSAITTAQNNKKVFDSIYYDIAVNITSSNPLLAIHLADSLILYSTDKQQKMRSVMLLADILEKQERREESIQQSLKALKIAISMKDYFMQARIYGFLSTQYRTIGFFDKGKAYLEKGIAISSKIENKESVSRYMGMANQEMADYAKEEKEYEEAIHYLELALLSYAQEKDSGHRDFQLANAEKMLGDCYLALKQEDKAFEHYQKANILIKRSGAKDTLWAALIYQSLGNMYLLKNITDSAGVYLKKALILSEIGNNGSLKEDVYNSIAKYYEGIKELDSFVLYNTKYKTLLTENTAKKRQMISREFTRLNSDQESDANDNSLYIILSITGILVFAGGTLYFIKNKTPEKNAEKGIENIDSSSSLNISPKTERQLIDKLEEFEASEIFLKNNMSFSVLVSYLNTNSKYVNHILKTEKEKDFNIYINDLRIAYIIDKLKTDPIYLNYKVSYLAEISGFSSHSNFSSNFKRVTEYSPTEFIENITKSSE